MVYIPVATDRLKLVVLMAKDRIGGYRDEEARDHLDGFFVIHWDQETVVEAW